MERENNSTRAVVHITTVSKANCSRTLRKKGVNSKLSSKAQLSQPRSLRPSTQSNFSIETDCDPDAWMPDAWMLGPDVRCPACGRPIIFAPPHLDLFACKCGH